MLIGLGWNAQVGKDEVGKILVKNHGFKRYAFADILRKALYNLNPTVQGVDFKNYSCYEYYTIQELVDDLGWEEAKKFPEVRSLLQRMGTECGRKLFGEHFWVNQTFEKMEKDGVIVFSNQPYGYESCIHYENVVITDCRFDNEAQAIKDRGGVFIKVTREGVKPPNNHASEQGISEHLIDGYIRNNGTLEELELGIAEMIKFLGEK